MGATKRHLYTESQLEMANLCKALGHPARITIVEKLLEYENLNCSDLRFFIPLAQSTISQHLAVLYEVGILGCQVENNNAIYIVNKEIVSRISEYLQKVARSSEKITFNKLYTYFKPSGLLNLKT